MEILDHGKWGKLAHIGDPASLAKAILVALQGGSDPEQLRAHTLEFPGDQAAAAYERLIEVKSDKSATVTSIQTRRTADTHIGTGRT